MKTLSHRFCVAPMMDWTDRHCRYFLRLLSRHTLLYTEMVTTGALLHGDTQRFLRHDPAEHPVAIQLGGSDPADLAACSRMAEKAGYDEVNLNVGCPSDRVQQGKIGACLMAEPELVAACVSAMQEAVDIPVTVKSRIGIDELDSYDFLVDFVGTLAEAGTRCFILHARKAILSGLSPKENRSVPPLDYARVYRIKQDFPGLEIIINGGITSHTDARNHLHHVDGVMIGREAYQHPYFLATVDRDYFGDTQEPPGRSEVLRAFLPYVAAELKAGTQLKHMTRHILGLFQGQSGARKFRRHLSEHAHRQDAGLATLEQAAELMQY